MNEIALTPLRGRNPLGLFAALGALDVATRALPGRRVKLWWSDDVDPYAIIDGPDDVDHLIDVCWADVDRWRTSPVFVGPNGDVVDDVKVPIDLVPAWFEQTVDPVDRRLLAALVAERAKAKGKEEAKPSHFHFTAGQQKFLLMARQLRDGLTPDYLREALVGPWESLSELPVFGWDAKGERIYALSGPSPAGVKKTGVPGADWLGLLGLRFFPVTLRSVNGEAELETTGCRRGWKSGSFAWPLWDRPISAAVATSLVGHQGLGGYTPAERAAIGVSGWCTAPIRRSEQGGYGSFGAPVVETA